MLADKVPYTLLVVLLMIIASIPVPIAAAQPAQQPSHAASMASSRALHLCRPVVLNVSALGVSASSATPLLITPSGFVALPSIPYPVKKLVTSPIITDYLYKGKRLGSLGAGTIHKVLVEAKKEGARRVVKPIIWRRTVYVHDKGSGLLLTLLPCGSSSAPLKHPLEMVSRIRGLLGVYRVHGYYIALVKRYNPMHVPGYLDNVYLVDMSGERNGKPSSMIYSLGLSLSELAEHAVNRVENPLPLHRGASTPLRVFPGAGAEESSSYVWGVLAWGSTRFGPSEASLGAFTGSKGVRLSGWSWARSDYFLIPPRTVRYEVWVVLSSSTARSLRLSISLDGSVIEKEIEVNGVTGLGFIVHTVPESIGNYFAPWSRVTVSIAISPLDGRSLNGVVLKSLVVARSWGGELSGDNLFYRWGSYILGLGQSIGTIDENPSLEVVHGAGSFLALLPNWFAEQGPWFSVRVYSKPGAPQRLVRVYLGSSLVCQGYSVTRFYKGAYRQVFDCSASGSAVLEELLSSTRLGQAVPVTIEVSGATNPWFVEASPALRGWARAVISTTDLVYSVGSLDKNDAPYDNVLYTPGLFTVYASCLDGSYVEALGSSLALAATRPISGQANAVEASAYLLNYVKNPAICMNSSALTQLSVLEQYTRVTLHKTGGVEFSASGVVGAFMLGKARVSKKHFEELGVIGFELGVFSIMMSGGASSLVGVFSLIASAPSTFYKHSYTEYSATISQDAVEVEGWWHSGWEAATKAGLKTALSIKPRGLGSWGRDASVGGVGLSAYSLIYEEDVSHGVSYEMRIAEQTGLPLPLLG